MGNKTAKQKPSAKKETRVEAPTEAAAVDKKPKRKFNVIVWGATGFTGALVCKHIAEQYHKVRTALQCITAPATQCVLK